jgi:hypothetical protein
VKTRTLLLLAVGCGLAILAAGVVFLLQLASEEEPEYLGVGGSATVGDLVVTVDAYDETPDAAVVTVTMSGVDDPDGVDSFHLAVPEHVLSPSGDAADRCAAMTVAEQTCTLTFALADAAGGSRLLVVERGDAVARWELRATG